MSRQAQGTKFAGARTLMVLRGLVTLGFVVFDVYVGFHYSLRSASLLAVAYFLLLPAMIWVTAWVLDVWSDWRDRGAHDFQD